MAEKPTFRRVYIWEWPVRIYHWTTAGAMVVLVGTGLLMGNALAFVSTSEASQSYWFGTTRFLHFTAAYLFFFAFVLRLYWMFAGNRFSRWSAFIPIGRFRPYLHGIGRVVRVDILQLQKKPIDFLGHNPLAATSYFVIFLLSAFQIASGFAMYAPMSQAWIPQWFAWVVPMLGGDADVKFWHHAVMWVFILFVTVHVYMVVFHDVVEAKGEVSSIVTGSRVVEDQ